MPSQIRKPGRHGQERGYDRWPLGEFESTKASQSGAAPIGSITSRIFRFSKIGKRLVVRVDDLGHPPARAEDAVHDARDVVRNVDLGPDEPGPWTFDLDRRELLRRRALEALE